MTESLVDANGIALCAETFGSPAHPAVLLVMGAAASMVRWEDDFCVELADRGRYVMRYDSRDTGRSTTVPFGAAHYTLLDLADDAVALLDALSVSQAHLVGLSMGGMVAQLVALRHPDRVTGLTLVATTCDPQAATRPAEDDADPDSLTGPRAEFVAALAEMGSNPDGLPHPQHQAELYRLLNGSGRPYDAAVQEALARRELDRANELTSGYNHQQAILSTPAWRHELHRITVPVTVLHGTEDPMMSLAHGRALAAEIPGARLLPLEGAGHEMHRQDWGTVMAAIRGGRKHQPCGS